MRNGDERFGGKRCRLICSDLREIQGRKTVSWVNTDQQHAVIIFDRITVRKIRQSRGRKHLTDSLRFIAKVDVR